MNTIYNDWQILSPQNTKQAIDESGYVCEESFFSGNKDDALEEAKKRAQAYCRLNKLEKIRVYCGSKKAMELCAFDECVNQ